MLTAEMIDLQQEPRWRLGAITPDSLRASVLGRANSAEMLAKQLEISLPNIEVLQAAIEGLRQTGMILHAALPSATEGARVLDRNSSKDEASYAVFRKIEKQLAEAPQQYAWHWIGRATCVLEFDEGLLDAIKKAMANLPLKSDPPHEQYFDIAATAAYVAATQQRTDVADAVSETLMKHVVEFTSEVEADAGFRLLLICAASNEQRSQWLRWLEQKVTAYSFNLPKGKPCAALVNSLAALNQMLPLQDRCFAKARKLASMAAV